MDKKIKELIEWAEERRCAYSYGSYMMGQNSSFENGAESAFQEVLDKIDELYNEHIKTLVSLGYTKEINCGYRKIINNCRIGMYQDNNDVFTGRLSSLQNNAVDYEEMQEAYEIMQHDLKILNGNKDKLDK